MQVGRIYKIQDRTTNLFYIGSTFKNINDRLKQHERKYKNFLDGNLINKYTSFEILKNDDYFIEEIAVLNVENQKELNKFEGQYIQLYKNDVVNKRIEGFSNCKYYLSNMERINRKFICNCGSIITYRMRNRHFNSNKHLNNVN